MDASLFRAFLQEREYNSGSDIMQHACSHGGYALQFAEFFMAPRADQRHYWTFGDVPQMLTVMKVTGKRVPWFNQLCEVSYNLYLLLHKQWKPRTKRSLVEADVPMSRAAHGKLSYTGLCMCSAPNLSQQAAYVAAHRLNELSSSPLIVVCGMTTATGNIGHPPHLVPMHS